MLKFFGKKPPPPPTEVTAQAIDAAQRKVDNAIAVESAVKGVQSGIAAAAAIGVGAVIASGPALPVVAGIGILAAAGLRLYAQNKKLTRLFQRTAKLTQRILPILDAIERAKERRAMLINVQDVRTTAEQLQITIGQLLGPQAVDEINKAVLDAEQKKRLIASNDASRLSWTSRLNRLSRIFAPTEAITRMNEQLIQLSLDFSVLQGEFAIQLETLAPAEAQMNAKLLPVNSLEVLQQNKGALDAAKQGADTPQTNDEAPTTGAKRTRRRRKRRATRRN